MFNGTVQLEHTESSPMCAPFLISCVKTGILAHIQVVQLPHFTLKSHAQIKNITRDFICNKEPVRLFN